MERQESITPAQPGAEPKLNDARIQADPAGAPAGGGTKQPSAWHAWRKRLRPFRALISLAALGVLGLLAVSLAGRMRPAVKGPDPEAAECEALMRECLLYHELMRDNDFPDKERVAEQKRRIERLAAFGGRAIPSLCWGTGELARRNSSRVALAAFCAQILAKIKPPPLDELIAVLREGEEADEATRLRWHGACILLEDLGPAARKAIPTLILRCEEKERYGPGSFAPTAYTTRWALRSITPAADDLPELLPLLRHTQRLVRRDAAGVIGRIDPPQREAAPELVRLLDDEEREVRLAAAGSLAAITPGTPEGVEAARMILRHLSEENENLRRMAHRPLENPRALSALIALGRDAKEPLQQMHKECRWVEEKRRALFWAVVEIKP